MSRRMKAPYGSLSVTPVSSPAARRRRRCCPPARALHFGAAYGSVRAAVHFGRTTCSNLWRRASVPGHERGLISSGTSGAPVRMNYVFLSDAKLPSCAIASSATVIFRPRVPNPGPDACTLGHHRPPPAAPGPSIPSGNGHIIDTHSGRKMPTWNPD